MNKADLSINTAVTFRHTEPTVALKSYATEKIEGVLRKFLRDEAEVDVVLSVEKRDHIAEAKVSSKGMAFAAKAKTDDLYSAIDKAMDALHAQLRKTKERSASHKT